MQAIKCELCGSHEFTKVDGFFQCQHCGVKYSIEETKKMMLSGSVELVKGESEKNRLLKNVQTFISLNKYVDANRIMHQLTNEYPEDYYLWIQYSKLVFLSMIKSTVYAVGTMDDAFKYIDIAKQLHPSFDSNAFYDEVVALHGDNLLIIKKQSDSNDDFLVGYMSSGTKLGIFDVNLICYDYDKLPKSLQDLQFKLSTEYANNFLHGQLTVCDFLFWHSYGCNPDDLPYNNEVMRSLYLKGKDNAKKFEKSQYKAMVAEKIGFPKDDTVLFILGKIAITLDYDGRTRKYDLSRVYTEELLNTSLPFLSSAINTKKDKENHLKAVKSEILNLCISCTKVEGLLIAIAKFNNTSLYYTKTKNPNMKTIVKIIDVDNDGIYFCTIDKMKGALFDKGFSMKYHLHIDDFDKTLSFIRKELHRCPHCGMKLPLFSNTCKSCGK